MNNKKKILVLSDHALSTSGVGTQTRHLINGLLKKGCWTFRQYGAAIKHSNYDTVVVNEDFIIKPIDGFGNRDLIRVTLATEKPDLILIFTDPRFFLWLFEMEDEIHQTCPIAWWHVWDNRPSPEFNKTMYEATDLINCHSYVTYEICKEMQPAKTNFIPHALPEDIFYEMSPLEKAYQKQLILGPRKDHFIGLWVGRNAKRKRPNDMLWAWAEFLKKLEHSSGHRNASLIMHTDPRDQEGPNLMATSNMLGIKDNVIFSNERIGFEQMNVLHNISDFCINTSFAEGFGLPTLEAMQCGTPIIAPKTGGLTRQVVDHRDNSENGFALPIEFKTLVGSQMVPYIYEDYTSVETISEAIMNMYNLGESGRRFLGKKAKKYVADEFAYQTTIDKWHETLLETIENWESRYDRVRCIEI